MLAKTRQKLYGEHCYRENIPLLHTCTIITCNIFRTVPHSDSHTFNTKYVSVCAADIHTDLL